MSATYPATVEGLTAALAALGDTIDHVARVLAAGGYLGDRGACCTCPVSAYLMAAIRNLSAACVDFGSVQVWPRDVGDPAVVPVAMDLPRPVAAFILQFDAGFHPRLVATR